MFAKILEFLGGSAVTTTINNMFALFASASERASFKKMIQDLVEDEIVCALQDANYSKEDIHRYNRINKKRLAEEISVRIDPILRAKTDSK